MEDDTWSFAFSASSRSYQSTLKSQSDLCIDFEEIEEDDELKTEYPCPYCSEDFDLLGLCCHIDEEHHLEAGYGVCPVCALRIGMNMFYPFVDCNVLTDGLMVDREVHPPPLSDKEHLEKAKRCEFVQGLLFSTIFDGGL
ncbi:hypothetical protein PTKIN_Ptkin12aG0140200 [Pterospermum kingtungense]